MRLTWYRKGYIDGLHGDVQKSHIFGKNYRQYNKGYAKGLYWLYYRLLNKQLDRYEAEDAEDAKGTIEAM